MRSLLLLALLWPSLAFGGWMQLPGPAVVVNQGGVAPDISWDFESATTCSSLFSAVYGTTDCASTAHPLNGTYAAKLSSGAVSGFRYNFPSNHDEVWLQGAIYRDAVTPTAIAYFLTLTDSVGSEVTYTYQVNTSRVWTVRNIVASATYNGTNAATGQVYHYFRLHVKRGDTDGEIHLWTSTNGTSWNVEVSQTAIDTSNSTNQYNRILIGRNNGSNLPEDWYMDDIKLWYSNPGW